MGTPVPARRTGVDGTYPDSGWDEVELMDEEPRPDAALGLEGVPHTGEAMTAEGILVEP